MKKILITLVLVFSATQMFAQREEYTREIKKEFSVNSNAELSITNKYGDVKIVEGNEGKIIFTIKITGKDKNAKKAQEYAEKTDVNFTHKGNHVSAKTTIETMNCNNCGINVNYVVIVPRSTTMNFDVKYGNLILNNTTKPLNIDMKYGNISANNIADAKIDIGYGKISMAQSGNLNLTVKYSNITINKVGYLRLDSKYSNFAFGEILAIKSDFSKYDGFKIGAIDDFEISTGYADVVIQKLNKTFVTENFKYCKLIIASVAEDFSKIKINASYTNVQVGLNERHNFKANLFSEYGNIKYGDVKIKMTGFGVANFTEKDKSSKHSTIFGNAGKSDNPTAVVDITTRYGGIIFK